MAGKYNFISQDSIEINLLEKYNTYPAKALISKEDWSEIESYYTEQAPAKLASRSSASSLLKSKF